MGHCCKSPNGDGPVAPVPLQNWYVSWKPSWRLKNIQTNRERHRHCSSSIQECQVPIFTVLREAYTGILSRAQFSGSSSCGRGLLLRAAAGIGVSLSSLQQPKDLRKSRGEGSVVPNTLPPPVSEAVVTNAASPGPAQLRESLS